MKNTRKGFTLVELLVVIAILAILATVSVVGYTSFINRANDSVAQQELTQIRDYYIASQYTDKVAVNQSLVQKLGLQGEIFRGKVGDDVIYKYTVKTGAAYWNTKTNSISTGELDGWAEVACDHDWLNATCTEAKTCKLCGATEGQALGHSLQDIAGTAVEAKCGAAGKEANKECSECGYIEQGAPTAALEHEDTTNDYKCDREGCGADMDHEHVYTGADCVTKGVCACGTEGNVDSTKHKKVVTDAKVPETCGADGKTEGSHCESCSVVIIAQQKIDATGNHAFAGADCVTKGTCTTCGAEGAIEADNHNMKDGLCTRTGCTYYDETYRVYYLIGNINGSDYTGKNYKFENGKLTVTFTSDSYVYVDSVTAKGVHSTYLSPSTYATGMSATLSRGTQAKEKMFVPGGVQVTFTLTGSDNAYTLSMDYAGTMIYFKPSTDWKVDNARFAIYMWNDGGNRWIYLNDTDGDGIYEGKVPTGYTNIKFVRLTPNDTANNWNTKWNEDSNTTVPTNGNNLYTIKTGAGDNKGGTWSKK